ncbi:glycosyltransferase family 39 protein [Dyadobacter sp. CY261]|uniref:ArnT family glycosyltransferase n=1 Tax=Dyadobacter sp. CY261 TaxID=2907203 RepID=UPI001F45D400|nr:glycosyltransferase family 39 protein [Dyadobacter sp. CY261]MCF0075311.1 glycosyltransferase family 39 protein [Dyadobacter sp. CY261]
MRITVLRDQSTRGYFPWMLAFGILLNLPGLWLDIMEPDGALYATIAKHIVLSGDWINLIGDGHDWLDKPHLPFWIAAASFKLLGITSFAYKLPAFICWLIGLRYIYLTASYLFKSDVAKLSVLIYVVALHSVLANFDVRAEPYLTTCIIAAIWHLLGIYTGKNWSHIPASAFFMACAVMVKGIFALVIIGSGWVIFWILSKKWEQFTNYKWWVALGLCLTFILPELLSLYVQFDMHPEKIVFGKTHVSGLRFFFWDSQFGRFFNTGPIKGKGDVFFFLHTTLWAFLPWSVGLIGGLVYLIGYEKQFIQIRWVIYGCALVSFIIFSLSRFQLPHYIIIVFPYLSMITAHYFLSIAAHPVLKYFVWMQTGLLLATGLLIIALLYSTGINTAVLATAVTIIIVIAANTVPTENLLVKLVCKGYATAAIIYVFLFFFFYPFLLKYQSGRRAAAHIPASESLIPTAAYKSFSYTFEFYAPGNVRLINQRKELAQYLNNRPCYLYTTRQIADSIQHAGIEMEILARVDHFHITKLKKDFLTPKSRRGVLEARCLLYFGSKHLVKY